MDIVKVLRDRLSTVSTMFWAFCDGKEAILRDDWREYCREELRDVGNELKKVGDYASGAADVTGDERFLLLLEAMHLLLTHVEVESSGVWIIRRSNLSKYTHGHILEHFLDGRQNWREFLESSHVDYADIAERMNDQQVKTVPGFD
jgi:hypothetical protein